MRESLEEEHNANKIFRNKMLQESMEESFKREYESKTRTVKIATSET